MFKGTSFYADSVDMAMLIIVGISVLFLLGIVAAMIFFVIRYSRKRNPVATQIEGNMLLEVIWIAIPLVIVLGMFWLGWKDFYKLRQMSDYAMQVQVQGRMWKWDFTYPNGKVSDTLYIPVGKVVKLEMQSVDVNHSFFIPAFRLKEDVIANRKTYMIINPEKEGNFDIACAEYCGLNHAYMYTMLKVVSQDAFDEWIENTPASDSSKTEVNKDAALQQEGYKEKAVTETMVEEIPKTNKISKEEYTAMITKHPKFKLLVKHACVSCHTTDGSTTIGPSFAKLSEGNTKVVTNGKNRNVKISKDYIISSILEPDSDVVQGFKPYTMPSMRGRISEKDLTEIVDILMGK